MVTHSSILIWKIPWTEEPGGLQSMGLQRVGHDLVTERARIMEIQTWISGSLSPLSYHTFTNLSGGPAHLPFSLFTLSTLIFLKDGPNFIVKFSE